jgi:hypothetical protein
MIFDLHRLLQECSWGIKQGLGIITCNTEDLIVIVCVFLEVFLTALWESDLLAPSSEFVLHSGMCLMFLCALGRDLGT